MNPNAASNEPPKGDTFLKVVQALAISPDDARARIDAYRSEIRRQRPGIRLEEERALIADKVVSRYAKLAATAGAASALPGIIPGIGTVVATLGGAAAGAAACMKLQVDMSMCLAATYGWDLDTEDARHLSFLIAAGAALENAGSAAAVQIGSKAGVAMLRMYLKGAALTAVKEFFKRVGIVFTRKALEKAMPFGIGVIVGLGANYALTRYVGKQAIEWFTIDARERA